MTSDFTNIVEFISKILEKIDAKTDGKKCTKNRGVMKKTEGEVL